MTELQWGRLLETAYRRDACDLVLTAGGPAMMRLVSGWRELQMPWPSSVELTLLAREHFDAAADVERPRLDFAKKRVDHRGVASFTVMVYGSPHVNLIIATRP